MDNAHVCARCNLAWEGPTSHCPECQHDLQVYANGLGGKMDEFRFKCKHCGVELKQGDPVHICVSSLDGIAEAKVCSNKEGAVWLESPTVHVVGNNNTVNVPDKTQQFEQRCWELFLVVSQDPNISGWDNVAGSAIMGTQVFEAKMKELQEKEGEG